VINTDCTGSCKAKVLVPTNLLKGCLHLPIGVSIN